MPTFFAPPPLEPGRTTTLGETEAHHARVRRLAPGEMVRLVDGEGGVACGRLVRVMRSAAHVAVETVSHVQPLPPIHLLLPVADRERMLWLAEKAAEFGVQSWRPVHWTRSRSVSPRGEGVTFQARVRSRMIGALTQSGGAWLPALFPEATLERAVAAAPIEGARIVLSQDGQPLHARPLASPVTVAVGPEGGFEPEELAALVAAGFRAVTLAPLTLRFETAGLAALATVRAAGGESTEDALG